MSTIKKIWHDPVWSKVIAAGVVALVTSLANHLFHWWSWVGLLKHTNQLIKASWAFFFSTSPVPHWLIGLGIILSIIAAATLIMVIIAAIAARPAKSAQQSQVDWHAYTTDLFYGVRWRWDYEPSGQVRNPICFCPRCDCQLAMEEPRGILELTIFHCPRCEQIVKEVENTPYQIEQTVVAFIERKLRNDLWKTESAERQTSAN